MNNAEEYLAYVKALIIANSKVIHWTAIREEAQGNTGLFRYRLTLSDGGVLELFERFEFVELKLQVTKYRFHWQAANGRLLKRWDNAAHHPEMPTHPHHVHNGSEENVVPHGAISTVDILAIISVEVKDKDGQ